MARMRASCCAAPRLHRGDGFIYRHLQAYVPQVEVVQVGRVLLAELCLRCGGGVDVFPEGFYLRLEIWAVLLALGNSAVDGGGASAQPKDYYLEFVQALLCRRALGGSGAGGQCFGGGGRC